MWGYKCKNMGLYSISLFRIGSETNHEVGLSFSRLSDFINFQEISNLFRFHPIFLNLLVYPTPLVHLLPDEDGCVSDVHQNVVGCFCEQDDLFRRSADLCAPGDLFAPGDLSRSPPGFMRVVEVGGQKIGAFQQISSTQEASALQPKGSAIQRESKARFSSSSSTRPRILMRFVGRIVVVCGF